jgi:predicted dehydrogenase/threonine dehydrogenase-like Zn-dependent dehydrogenase
MTGTAMRQVLQNLRTGKTEVAGVPAPALRPGHLLIRTRVSLISAGTERMLLEFGQAGWVGKARQQPDKVRQVLDKVRTDGLAPTIEAVLNRLNQPLPLGYCNAGEVIAVAEGVTGFAVGDRVASNGQHAEVVCVPKHLCARVPEGVSDETAAFTVPGAIGLQGVRLAQPTLGESVAVLGLGLIGLLAVQLLRAQGCRVLGVDLDPARLALARQVGVATVDLSAGTDPVAAAEALTDGRGMDAVLITAATESDEPVRQAARMCRKRGRVVLVGVAGLKLSRADFYQKELSLQVSCSYGPGRYDPNYEERGQDYPIGFVRWTAQRNFEAVIALMAEGKLDVGPLISHRYPITQAEQAYDLLTGAAPSLGVLLEYPAGEAARDARTVVLRPRSVTAPGRVVASFIGAGNYATRSLLPAFKAAGVRLRMVATSSGVNGWHAGRKFGFEEATTDVARALADPETAAVVIATRHDTHGRFVVEALRAGKHVFVEKPLCRTWEELEAITGALGSAPGMLMVGFNRRFAPQVQKMKALLGQVVEPKAFVVTVNAGAVPGDHWTLDPEVGGGRILGEACHFIDLLRYLAGSAVEQWARFDLGRHGAETVTLQLGFTDGSIGTIHYCANGARRFPKERIEVFCAGRVLWLDNFRRLRGYGWPGFSSLRLWRQDKGQCACVGAFVDAVERGVPAPVSAGELLEVARVALELAGVGPRQWKEGVGCT